MLSSQTISELPFSRRAVDCLPYLACFQCNIYFARSNRYLFKVKSNLSDEAMCDTNETAREPRCFILSVEVVLSPGWAGSLY
jgi:hypothetical protein